MEQENTCPEKKNNRKNKGCQKEANEPSFSKINAKKNANSFYRKRREHFCTKKKKPEEKEGENMSWSSTNFSFWKKFSWKEHRKGNWKWETKKDNDKERKSYSKFKVTKSCNKRHFCLFFDFSQKWQKRYFYFYIPRDKKTETKDFRKKKRVKDNEHTIHKKKRKKTKDTIKNKCNVTVLSCVMCVCPVWFCIKLRCVIHTKTLWEVINEESHETPKSKTRYRSSTEVIKQITPPTKNGHGGVWSDVTWFRVVLCGCVSVSVSVSLSFSRICCNVFLFKNGRYCNVTGVWIYSE